MFLSQDLYFLLNHRHFKLKNLSFHFSKVVSFYDSFIDFIVIYDIFWNKIKVLWIEKDENVYYGNQTAKERI
jgi:hypothetical protein